ncbi:embryonic polyadenylate-binding protein 2 [Orycteropus afer afer]|uniref:Embryonic polyadenylate-binding protein 2 n=1 Tax=Orycteropus afer afer TaxID=1230840 RepID=A0A8B6ZQN6_ORYAF|nr:embryonic polyadenylate-binding protein 2 [Orycteropus afer afer]
MWPFSSSSLFPPPTEAWLQRAASDPEAQGWGAWSRARKPPLGPGCGEEEDKKEEDAEDSSFLLSLLERENLAECPVPEQELEAIKLKLWAIAEAREPRGLPAESRAAVGEEGSGATLAVQRLPSPETVGSPFLASPHEKMEADHRSVYVGNVDYGATAEELEAHFNPCGEIHRVTILCDKFSRHPKGYAYIEFATESSAQAAVKLDESVFRTRVIKVQPKRTNFPGISSTDRGGLQGHPSAREGPFHRSSVQGGPRFRARGMNCPGCLQGPDRAVLSVQGTWQTLPVVLTLLTDGLRKWGCGLGQEHTAQ